MRSGPGCDKLSSKFFEERAIMVGDTVVKSNTEIVREYVDRVFNEHNLDQASTYLAPEVKWHGGTLGTIEGRENVTQMLRGFIGALPDLHAAEQDVVADGRWRGSARRRRGDAPGKSSRHPADRSPRALGRSRRVPADQRNDYRGVGRRRHNSDPVSGRRVHTAVALLMSTTATSTTTPETGEWSVWHIDPSHSVAEFSVRHMMVTNVKGRFMGISGNIVDAREDPNYSSVKAAIDVTTLITGDPQRDEHLRSPDFFDIAKYPSITFESRKISGSRDKFTVTGDLTIHGVTREVRLDVTFNGTGTNPLGKIVAGFTAETRINRKDFGLNWNMALEAGGFLVGDEAKIVIELEAVRDDPLREPGGPLREPQDRTPSGDAS